MFQGQQDIPHLFDKDETKKIMEEEIDIYEATPMHHPKSTKLPWTAPSSAVPGTNMGVAMKYSVVGKVKRRDFLRWLLVVFAALVTTSAPVAMMTFTPDNCVSIASDTAAIQQAVEQLRGVSPEAFHDAYMDFVFPKDGTVPSVLGYYAKDGTHSPLLQVNYVLRFIVGCF